MDAKHITLTEVNQREGADINFYFVGKHEIFVPLTSFHQRLLLTDLRKV